MKRITFLLLISVFHNKRCIVADNIFPEEICKERKFGLVSHPTDCHKYVHCNHGAPIERNCATKDLFFNPLLNICDYKRNVKCPGNRCNNRNGGCDQKCVYINDNNYVCTCESGYEPDINNDQKKCIQGSINMETYCKGNEDKILPDPRSCTTYIQCVGSTHKTMSCPGGTIFNKAIKTCDWPYNVKCQGQDFTLWSSWSSCFKPGADDSCIQKRKRTCSEKGRLCTGWTSEIKPCKKIKCRKVDPCALNNGGCMDQCRNQDGKALCSCTDGKLLASDKKNCIKGSCGVAPLRDDSIIAFIINGQSTVKGSYPWQAAIYEKKFYDDGEEENELLCGGSLIDDRHVLSAVHCFDGFTEKQKEGITIVLGEHDRFKSEGTESVFSVASIITHKDFDYERFTDDIAIITLSKKVTYSDYVAPLCLPDENEELTPNTNCRISGWGKMLTETGREKADILQEITVPVVKETVCKNKNNYGDSMRKVTDKMICTGADDGKTTKTACHYDSGGPLTCMIDGVWKLYGIVSWGDPTCNILNSFNVFTKVSKYIDWINGNKK